MTIYLFRHGMTRGNAEKRYIGATDEGLIPGEPERLKALFREVCQKEPSLLAQMSQKEPSLLTLFVSPMRRCAETAEVLAGVIGAGREFRVVDDLRECDFGEFEYRNYEELKDEPAYQRFLETRGESGFPGGESRAAFSKRCAEAFASVCREWLPDEAKVSAEDSAAAVFVVHGGTIMAIMDAFARPHRDYYDWQVKPGEGFRAELTWESDETGRPMPVLIETARLLSSQE